VTDEARKFGIGVVFRTVGIYSSVGQKYSPLVLEPVDVNTRSLQGREGRADPGRGKYGSGLKAYVLSRPGSAYERMGSTRFRFSCTYSMSASSGLQDFIWARGGHAATRGFMLAESRGRTTAFGRRFAASRLAIATCGDCRCRICWSTFPRCL